MNARELIERAAAAWNAQDLDAIHDLHVGEDFAVCEWTASSGSKEWDGVDVFPLGDGKIARKDVYSSSHRPRDRDPDRIGPRCP